MSYIGIMSEIVSLSSKEEMPSTGSSLMNPLPDQSTTQEDLSKMLTSVELPKLHIAEELPTKSGDLCQPSKSLAIPAFDIPPASDNVDNISDQNQTCQSEKSSTRLSLLDNEIPENEINRNTKDSGSFARSSLEYGTKAETQEKDAESVLLCRLCAVPCQGSAPIFLFQHPPHHPEVLSKKIQNNPEEEVVGDILLMIRETLPIKVSCCDKLPKQVCKVCVEQLRLSHAFTTTVLKAESQLNSLRANQKPNDPNDKRNPLDWLSPYDCPMCEETPSLPSKQIEPSSSLVGFQGESFGWGNISVKNEPEDPMEPSSEELERSYHEYFGGQEAFKTEERITLKPLKPICPIGRRPRGRPRSRPFKVTPRGRRGRRSMQTTVEKILDLGRASHTNDDYGFRIRSRENNPATEALTQCLLCERWLPGSAACLQHSLAEHMDCGAFLCPRCPRDDFPGDFELIQHYQESHCPDLELYEVLQTEKNRQVCSPNNAQYNMQAEAEPHIQQKTFEPCIVKEEDQSTETESVWAVETMDYETLNNTPSNDLYESQDEVSSNLSELAPRSLTSHSALFEEESNSISTHGSDSNLVSEDTPDKHILHDKMMVEASSLVDEVSFSDSPCTLGAGDFTSDLRAMEEETQDDSKVMDKPRNVCEDNVGDGTNDYKALQEESQDSLRADELCGFQEAISEKNEEVNLNGSSLHFDSDISSAPHGDLGEI